MINAGDVFIKKDSDIKLKVLRSSSYTGKGFDLKYYCILERSGNCWNAYHTALYIERYYTKMESL